MVTVGVIGCGYWGPNLIRNFNGLPDVRLKTISDLDEKRLHQVGLLYPNTTKTTNHRDILEDPEIDAVVVATPMSTHFPLGCEVLEAGKHLFLEKPMATTSADCRKLNELAEERDLQIMVGHTFVYTPAVRKIKSLMVSGELGEVYYVNISRVNLGIFQNDANVVWDLAPHDVAMLNYLFQAHPTRVSANGRCYVQRERGIEDVAFVNLEYPGHRMAHIHVSWLNPNKIRTCTFVGSRKMLVYDDVSQSEKIRVYDKGVDVQPHYSDYGEFQLLYRSGDIFVPRIETTEPLRIETQHFLDVVNGQESNLSSGTEGEKVVRVLEGACQSMVDDGKPVDLDLGD
ncbi:Gfo/Idh/MocA family oxidoreductase [bacterium]|nr:Gfo/Idh/MocA family oxidoreductase [bacterium]PIV80386.1 MAG: oxidoreductase [bacterium CG17_big_fil_post_rev_8_21_14_2_50_64_8]PJA75599.1 MAG: oxidoreductase [bacterium CG_4_9_14_3_um_filter_65_15]